MNPEYIWWLIRALKDEAISIHKLSVEYKKRLIEKVRAKVR